MAIGWPAYGDISAREIGPFIEKRVVHGQWPLFPKADIRTAGNSLILGSAFGQYRTLATIQHVTFYYFGNLPKILFF